MDAADEAEVAHLMFSRHPQMSVWAHLEHEWRFYELEVAHVQILDFFGGFRNVSAAEYFAAEPAAQLQARHAVLR